MEKITGKLDVVKLLAEKSRQVSIPSTQKFKNKKRAARADATGRKSTKHKKRDW